MSGVSQAIVGLALVLAICVPSLDVVAVALAVLAIINEGFIWWAATPASQIGSADTFTSDFD